MCLRRAVFCNKKTALRRKLHGVLSVPISRVLYWTIIYPGLTLPRRLKRIRDATGSRICPIGILHRVGFTARTSRQAVGELLPRLSILTPEIGGGFFLLHSPWSRLHRPLAGTLPYGARTFLTPERGARSSGHLKHRGYCSPFFRGCQGGEAAKDPLKKKNPTLTIPAICGKMRVVKWR